MKITGYIEHVPESQEAAQTANNQYYIFTYPENLEKILKQQSRRTRRTVLLIFAVSVQSLWMTYEFIKMRRAVNEPNEKIIFRSHKKEEDKE